MHLLTPFIYVRLTIESLSEWSSLMVTHPSISHYITLSVECVCVCVCVCVCIISHRLSPPTLQVTVTSCLPVMSQRPFASFWAANHSQLSIANLITFPINNRKLLTWQSGFVVTSCIQLTSSFDTRTVTSFLLFNIWNCVDTIFLKARSTSRCSSIPLAHPLHLHYESYQSYFT